MAQICTTLAALRPGARPMPLSVFYPKLEAARGRGTGQWEAETPDEQKSLLRSLAGG